MTNTSEQRDLTAQNFDLLLNCLMPWGSSDVWHLVKTAEQVGVSMYELADILQHQADAFEVDLYNSNPTTDLNALFNEYIVQQASNDIESQTGINIVCDYDVMFFANYLDDPLQYSDECVEALERAIKENELTRNDFNEYSLYIFDEMGIEIY